MLREVCILMSTYNGERYLRQQIESILNQTGVKVHLIVRDDGSNDGTRSILLEYSSNDNIDVYFEPNLGVANSFWKMLSDAPDCDYYAWADQDDVWDEDKLKQAIEHMDCESCDVPLLYFSESRLTDEYLKPIGIERVGFRSIKLEHAIWWCTAQGSTMVFNRTLVQCARRFTPNFTKIKVYHDGWLARMCLILGGKLVYDPIPHMSYRIHQNNVVARNSKEGTSVIGKIIKYLKIQNPYFVSTIAKELMKGYGDSMPVHEKRIIFDISNCNSQWRVRKSILFSKEFYTGRKLRDISLIFRIIRKQL